MSALEALYERACATSVDIGEHLPKLRALATCCQTIVEFGVFHGASSTALLTGCNGYVYSYDVQHYAEIDPILAAAEGKWIFRIGDSRVAAIPECDLLFIDSWHTGEHLTLELNAHALKVKRWIVMHDTETFGARGEDGKPGLWGALQAWLEKHPEWKINEHFTNNNGLTVLGRA